MDTEAIKTKARNPVWKRDELVLALELYMKHKRVPSESHPDVIALSDLLGVLGKKASIEQNRTFRNRNGVVMKLANFQRLDPVYVELGFKGLSRGGKNEQIIWDEFAAFPQELAATAEAIRSEIMQLQQRTLLVEDDEDWVVEALEGRLLTRAHRYRERNKAIIESKKKQALKTLGRLACESCGCDFEKTYGEVGKGLIEVHHTKPLHTLRAEAKTKLEDLALLCANCHRVVHSQRKWLSVNEVRKAYRLNSRLNQPLPPLTKPASLS